MSRSAGLLDRRSEIEAADARGESADADATIERLKGIGYLNDQRFAESYASTRVENEGFGRMRVLSDLRARRVSGSMAEQAVDRALEGKSEAELIATYIERRMPSVAAGGKIEDEQKAGGGLPQAPPRRVYFRSDPDSAEGVGGAP